MFDITSSEGTVNNQSFLQAPATRVLAWAIRASFRLLRRAPARHFLRDILFVCLPFKMRFRVTMWFRHFVRHGALDRHFVFFCGPFVSSHLYWIFNSSFSKQYSNEIVFYLLLCGYRREALTLFRRLEWGGGNLSVGRMLEGTGIVGDGYSMDLLTQIHGLDWTNIVKQIAGTPNLCAVDA